MNMTDEQMRIAIAKACGWRQSERNTAHWHHVSEPYSHILFGDLPNYLNDLNAMHEAEKTLVLQHQILYQGWLGKITGNKCPALFGQIHATARQRAEAFVKTLNLKKP